jgi:exonuclease VII small subunit
MRVRISYGVDLEEIPEISQDLLMSAIDTLEDSVRSLKRALEELGDSNEKFSPVVTMLDKSRMKLSKADLTLSDLQAMLEGLDNHYNGEKNVPERRFAMDTSRDSTEQTEDT